MWTSLESEADRRATFFQVMSKYHVLFSACLLEEYGDIFEFPSDLHKYAIIRMLHFIGENGTAPVQLEEALVLNNQMLSG